MIDRAQARVRAFFHVQALALDAASHVGPGASAADATSRFRTQLGRPVGRVLNAERWREDQCVAEDGQPAALSALLIGRPSGGESFVKGASPSTPTRARTRSSSSRGIHHASGYSM